MSKPYAYFILLYALFNIQVTSAQTISPSLDSVGHKLSTTLSDHYKRYPQEKIFLHTDQNVYLSGQTIWYKAYEQTYGKPSALSAIVYVRLSDAKGKLIKQDMLPLKTSRANGNIALPDSLPTGWYRLQAFTAWMLNFDTDGIYHKNVYIQNIHDAVIATLVDDAVKTYHVNFFPEGGDLVEGNICNIAFKATDENGLPANVYGDVLDNNKNLVEKLVTVHDGMGSFKLEADANTSYNAQVHFPDGSVQNIPLPKIKKTGISMRVNAAPTTELEVMIANTGQLENYKNIIVVAEQNNGLFATYPLQLSRGINVFSFKKNSFSTGILRLTVFDERALPLAERIVYINNNDRLNLSLNKDTLTFSPKSKNVFTLNLKDNNNQPVKANLSVSITDAATGADPENNIYSYFLMSSELHGYIHQPAYYFSNSSDTLQQQLDLVMLTSGWRHFKWDTVFRDKPRSLKYGFEHTLSIAGKIENYHDQDDLRIKMMITNSDSSKNLIVLQPDSTGVFLLKDYTHQGTATINYEVVNKKNKRQPVSITFFKRGADTAQFTGDTVNRVTETKPVINKTFLDSVKSEQQNGLGIILKTVNVKSQQLTPTEQLIKNHVRRLETDAAYTLDLADTPLPPGDIMHYIQGRFPGLNIIIAANGAIVGYTYHGPSLLVRGDSTSGKTPNEPYFYIDEASATAGDVMSIPLDDVALIRFAPPPVWFAPLNGGDTGAILIYTKKYGDGKNTGTRMQGFDQYNFNGYSVTREFASPDYSAARHSMQPDYRTTLYWNHDLNTDDHGNIKIRFYNSDKAKKYRVTIQATDSDGRTGFLNEVF